MIKVPIGMLLGFILGTGCTWFYFESVQHGQFLARSGEDMLDSHTLMLSRDSNSISIDELALYDFCLNHKKMTALVSPDIEWHHSWINYIAERTAVEKAKWYLGFIPSDDKYLTLCKNVEHL